MSTFSQNLKEKTDAELIQMLDNHRQLTINSKRILYSFLESKEGFSSPALDALKEDINEHNTELDDLKYLRNLGFAIEEDNDSIEVRRSKTAKTYDLLGVFIGVFLLFNFLSFYQSVVDIRENGGDILIYVNASILFILGALGFILFYKCFNRYLEYFGFKIVRNSSGLMIKKQGVSTVESVLSENQLMYKKDEDKAFIYLKDDETKPIIVSRTNPIFHETLKVLHSRLT